ncbi:MAG: sulfite exporter TauE/SafE family protein [Pontixanthobacter sp.]
MDAVILQDILSLMSGILVGFTLGLIGGGGSILAVPLMLYMVGVKDTHVAIATSAAAVAVSAFLNLIAHARSGTVKWRCALLFAAFGVVGAAGGSTLGKMTQGDLLLGLFGLVMIVIGLAMLREKSGGSDPDVALTRNTALRLTPRLAAGGMVVGALSGFFGIGGGFLVVPGLVAATAMPILNAIGSSLVSVTAFGGTTAANYALDGLVDWRIAAAFIVGGGGGGLIGTLASRRLEQRAGALKLVFSIVVIGVGLFIAGKELGSLLT